MEQTLEMIRIAQEALEEKKGEDIKVIDISNISTIADYFIIATGTSDSQVKALIASVDERMEKAGYPIKQQEGQGGAAWILMDYGDVIIHVFDKEGRSFYNLERIWCDGKVVENI